MPNPYAPRSMRRPVAPEVVSPLDQFVTRMRQVGASDDEVQGVVDTWDQFDEQWTPAKRDAMLAWSDAELADQLAGVREEHDYATTTEAEAAAGQAAAAKAAAEAQAHAVIALPVSQVLEWVGTDTDRAAAIGALERGPDGAGRKTLLSAVDKLTAG